MASNIHRPENGPVQSEFEAHSFFTSHDEADILGRGSFGVIRRCQHQHLGSVAVKCLSYGGSTKSISTNVKEAKSRVKLLVQLKHTNIIQVYGVTTWGYGCFGIIIEEIKCGDLQDLMIEKQHIEIPWKLRFSFMLQIADALRYLHCHDPRKPYVHLDLKLENVLLTMEMVVKLADFGAMELARVTGATATTSISPSAQWTVLYAAPERLIDSTSKVTCAMDAYSYSMVAYEIITRREVFRDSSSHIGLLVGMIAHDGQKPNKAPVKEIKKNLKSANDENNLKIFAIMKKVMKGCWCHKSEDRLTMSQVRARLVEFAKSENPFQKEIVDISKKVIEMLTPSNVKKSENESSPSVPLSSHFPPFVRSHHNEVVNNQRTSELSVEAHIFQRESNDHEQNFTSPTRASALDNAFVQQEIFDLDGFVAIDDKEVWMFNFATMRLSPMPNVIFDHWGGSLVTYKNEVYAISGLYTHEMEKIDARTASPRWRRVASTIELRYCSGSAVCKDWLYSVGGWAKGVGIKSAEKYNLLQEMGQRQPHKWEKIPSMRCGRYYHAVVSNEDLLFAIGGKDETGGFLDSMECFDPSKNEWMDFPAMHTAKYFLAAVVVENTIYVIGGWDTHGKVLSTVEKYDVTTGTSGTWTEEASLNVARGRHSACVIRNKIYVAGGRSDVVEVLDLNDEDKSWKVVANFDELKSIYGMVAL